MRTTKATTGLMLAISGLCLLFAGAPASAADCKNLNGTAHDLCLIKNDITAMKATLTNVATSAAAAAATSEVAVIMATARRGRAGSDSANFHAKLWVLGSTIEDFPVPGATHSDYTRLAGNNAAKLNDNDGFYELGGGTQRNFHLPRGTYLFEIEQPRTSSVECQGTVSIGSPQRGIGSNFGVTGANCPRLWLMFDQAPNFTGRYDSGSFVRKVSGGWIAPTFRIPNVTAGYDQVPPAHVGSVKITRLGD